MGLSRALVFFVVVNERVASQGAIANYCKYWLEIRVLKLVAFAVLSDYFDSNRYKMWLLWTVIYYLSLFFFTLLYYNYYLLLLGCYVYF